MGVLKEYQRRGVGRSLFKAARAAALEGGYSFMQVKTVQMGRYDEYDRTNRFYLALGFKEFEAMRILMASPRALVPKEELLIKIWGADSDAEDNNVEAYISFLRKKLQFLGSSVTIATRRKVGYRLEAGDAEKP